MNRVASGFSLLLWCLLGVALVLAGDDATRGPVRRLPVLVDVTAGVAGEDLPSKPRTRGECEDGPRPCPWLTCRYHLAIEVGRRTGQLRLNHPGLEETGELPPDAESCALDVAEQGPRSQAEVAEALGNSTIEWVRQTERAAEAEMRFNGGPELLEVLRSWAPAPSPVGGANGLLGDVVFDGDSPAQRDRAADEARALEAWTVRVVALARAGLPLKAAWAIASYDRDNEGDDGDLDDELVEVDQETAGEANVPDVMPGADPAGESEAGHEGATLDVAVQTAEEEPVQQTTTKTNGAGQTTRAQQSARREDLEAQIRVHLEGGRPKAVAELAEALAIEKGVARKALQRLAARSEAHVIGRGGHAKWASGPQASPVQTSRGTPKVQRAKRTSPTLPAPRVEAAAGGDRELVLELLRASPERLALVDRVLSRLAPAATLDAAVVEE